MVEVTLPLSGIANPGNCIHAYYTIKLSLNIDCAVLLYKIIILLSTIYDFS